MSSTQNLRPTAAPPGVPGDQHLRRVEIVISNLLRAGVATSLSLIVIGTIVSFVRHPEYLKSPGELAILTHPEAAPLNSLTAVAAGLRGLRGQSIVALGLLVLIATPMMRVAVSTAAFLLEGDWLYTLITLGVFCLLMLSLVLGAVE